MQSSSLIRQLLLRSSSWLKVKRITAWILKMFDTLHIWYTQWKIYKLQLKGSDHDFYLRNAQSPISLLSLIWEPIQIKRGRIVVKRYGIVFTFFTTRAIHLQVACCGTVGSITSYNGINLIGVERELRERIEQWQQSKITQPLHHHNIQWIFNPQTASHCVQADYQNSHESVIWAAT